MNALDPILKRTRSAVARRRASVPLDEVQAAAAQRTARDPVRPLRPVLAGPGLAIIAEHKRRSPSAGLIRDDLELEDVVSAYERGGAAALSVLTEADSFGGSLDDLRRARAASSLPILRKDFIVDAYQVTEARAAGADVILLIVAALAPQELHELHAHARAEGLATLVEVHDAAELEIAVALEPEVIGINNRDLTTLEVDINRTLALRPQVPAGILVVAESGFRARAELDRVAAAGVDGVLVGEALMRAGDIEAACRDLAGVSAGRAL
ncbi:MAG: indole-3-glycerol phosphate synthase [Solirubrobacteraceae bacterium]|nr:indole-3-glycerol phosphate synthase [Solirubrobacteraceae bacterium]